MCLTLLGNYWTRYTNTDMGVLIKSISSELVELTTTVHPMMLT